MSEEHTYEQLVAKTRAGIAGGADEELWKTRIAALLRAGVARGEVALTGSLVRPDVGASSGNLLFSARFDDGSGECEHDLVLRYQPADGLMNRYDMGAQFRVQHALADAGVKVARPLCLDDNGSLLGTPGYIMRRSVGVAPGSTTRAGADGRGRCCDPTGADRRHDGDLGQNPCLRLADHRSRYFAGWSAPENSIGSEITFYTDALRFASGEIAESLSGYECWLTKAAKGNESSPQSRRLPALKYVVR